MAQERKRGMEKYEDRMWDIYIYIYKGTTINLE